MPCQLSWPTKKPCGARCAGCRSAGATLRRRQPRPGFRRMTKTARAVAAMMVTTTKRRTRYRLSCARLSASAGASEGGRSRACLHGFPPLHWVLSVSVVRLLCLAPRSPASVGAWRSCSWGRSAVCICSTGRWLGKAGRRRAVAACCCCLGCVHCVIMWGVCFVGARAGPTHSPVGLCAWLPAFRSLRLVVFCAHHGECCVVSHGGLSARPQVVLG